MLEKIDQLDRQIFLFLNGIHSPASDWFMGLVTDKQTWYPLYLLIIAYLFWKFGWRNGFFAVTGILLAVGFADLFASQICKPFFERLRPCHNPEISALVHMVRGCGGQFGFMSSHSANSFAIATVLFLITRKQLGWVWVMFIWAAIVAYSRIAVGVHYPGDIIAGGIAGAILGWFAYRIYGFVGFKYGLLSPVR